MSRVDQSNHFFANLHSEEATLGWLKFFLEEQFNPEDEAFFNLQASQIMTARRTMPTEEFVEWFLAQASKLRPEKYKLPSPD